MIARVLPDSPTDQSIRWKTSQLRLYVALGTPNSTRAEQNLRTALAEIDFGRMTPGLEVIDVSTHVKLALSDGVIVTPTLIGVGENKRHTIIGDLSDTSKLHLFLGILGASPAGGDACP